MDFRDYEGKIGGNLGSVMHNYRNGSGGSERGEEMMRFPSSGLLWNSIPHCHPLKDPRKDFKFLSCLSCQINAYLITVLHLD